MQLKIDEIPVRHLVADQFPKWRNLRIRPIAVRGWDNRTFHLGNNMLLDNSSQIKVMVYSGKRIYE